MSVISIKNLKKTNPPDLEQELQSHSGPSSHSRTQKNCAESAVWCILIKGKGRDVNSESLNQRGIPVYRLINKSLSVSISVTLPAAWGQIH